MIWSHQVRAGHGAVRLPSSRGGRQSESSRRRRARQRQGRRTARGDTDNSDGAGRRGKSPADDVVRPAEASLPEAVAQDHRGTSAPPPRTSSDREGRGRRGPARRAREHLAADVRRRRRIGLAPLVGQIETHAPPRERAVEHAACAHECAPRSDSSRSRVDQSELIGRSTGSACSSRPFRIEKKAVLAPMPSASDSAATRTRPAWRGARERITHVEGERLQEGRPRRPERARQGSGACPCAGPAGIENDGGPEEQCRARATCARGGVLVRERVSHADFEARTEGRGIRMEEKGVHAVGLGAIARRGRRHTRPRRDAGPSEPSAASRLVSRTRSAASACRPRTVSL